MHSALIAGNFTLDDITIGSCNYSCAGGPPSYAGLFLSTYKMKLTIAGCYGHEVSMIVDSLRCRNVKIVSPCNGCQATARFRLVGSKKREIAVIDPGCRITRIPEESFEYSIVNGVCGEIDLEVMKTIRERARFVYLDPQGLLRIRKRGKVEMFAGPEFIEYIKRADIVKVNREELETVTGISDPESAYAKMKIPMIFSERDRVMLLSSGKRLELEFKPVKVYDGIGMGDLFGAGFVLGMMISGERMGLALGHAAATAKPTERGLFKVPHWREVMGRARELERQVKEV